MSINQQEGKEDINSLVKENQRLRQALLQSEKRFELLSQTTSDAVWDWHLLTNEIWWNQGLGSLFGYQSQAIEQGVESWSGRIHPEDYQRVLIGVHAVIDQGGKQWSDEYRFRKSDGSYAYVLNRGYVLHDEQGKPYRMLGSMQDITEQKLSGQALLECQRKEQAALAEVQHQKARLERFFRQAPAAICVLDGPEMIFELVNTTFEQLYPGRDLSGKRVLEALPEMAQGPFYSILENIYQTGETFEGKEVLFPLARRQGGPLEDIYFNFIYQPRFDEQGKVDGILAFGYEITELVLARKQVEESQQALQALNQQLEAQVETRTRQLRGAQAQAEATRQQLYALFEQAPVAITILEGEQYVVQLANPAVCEIWGKTQQEVIAKPLFEAMPGIRHQGLEALLEGVRKSGQPYIGKELPVEMDRNGEREPVYFNFVYHPLRDQQGIIGAIAVVATDVTELVVSRKQVEAVALQLEDLNEELSKSNEELMDLNQQLEERVAKRTEQLKAAQAKAEAQRRELYALFMRVPAGIALLKGPALVYEMANQMFLEIVGHTPTSIEKAGREVFQEGIWDLMEQVYKSGEAYVAKEFKAVLDLNGEGQFKERYYDFVFQPIKDDHQQVESLLVTVLDVSHQVEAHKAILERKTYFQEMADKIPVMLWVAKPGGQCTYLNKQWYEYTGQTQEEALEIGWFSATHPDDFTRCQQVFSEANQHQEPFSLLYRLRRKDGVYHWMLNKGEPKYDQTGTFEGYVGVVLNVHEQQQAEERLLLSVKAGKVGIWEWDVVHNRASYSDLLQEMFGFKPGTFKGEFEGAYEVFQSVIHPDDRQYVNEQVAKAFADFEEEFYIEFRVVRPTGEIAWIAERGEVTFDQGQPVRMNGTCIDITTHKQAEQATQQLAQELAAANEELRAANEEIQAANEELSISNFQLSRINEDLDNFVYTASHDLKAPILNVEGLLKALEKQLNRNNGLNQTVEQIYQMLYESVNRFKATIRDLTEVARISKESEEDVGTIVFEEVLKEVLKDLEPQIQEAGAQLEVRLDCPKVRFSRKNLKSIFYNLLSNAVKYRSSDREPQIRVTCQTQEGYHLLLVEDNGLGMDMRQEDKIFALFKRLHNHVEGTGIGLYIVKRMIENAGGKIEVESKVGVGSTFKVYFKR